MQETIPCRWYLTMPLNAVPLFPTGIPTQTFQDLPEAQPNSLLFTDRHTLALSSAGFRSDNDWLMIRNISGGFVPQLTGSDDILTERGITGYGVTPVLVRPSFRTLVLDITLFGETPLAYQCARENLAYLISSDHMSAYNPDLAYYETLLPPPLNVQGILDLPNANCNLNPFTLTKECIDCDGERYRKHIDIFGLWLGNDGEYGDSVASLDTTMTGFVADPRWYSDTICIPLAGEATKPTFASGLGNGRPSHNNVDFIDPTQQIPDNTFRYRGSARTGFTIDLDITQFNGTAPFFIAGYNLFDTSLGGTNEPWRRFRHIDWVNDGGWNTTGFNSIIWDTENRVMVGTGAGGLETAIHPEMDADNNRSWEAFQLVPGRTYFIALEIVDSLGNSVDLPDGTELCYTERFMGV